MQTPDIALVAAGVLGSIVALVHGVLVQRLMVRPIGEHAADDRRLAGPIGRIVPVLLHFSTAAWFAGGLALIAAAIALRPEARLAVSVCVGGLYLFGVIGNAWATRGRHPGWMLLAAALVLIGLGAGGAG